MNNVLILVLVYISYLIIWGVVNLIAFTLSLVFKRPQITKVVSSLSQVVYYLLSFGLGIGILIFTISLLLSGQIFYFILMLIIGISIVTGAFSLLQMPFLLIPTFFESKLEAIESEPDFEKAEILDKDNKIISVIEPEKGLNRKLALYFIFVYFLNLFSLIKNRSEYPNYLFGDYIVSPFLWTLSTTLFFGVIIGIFNLIRHKKFFFPRKKIFLIKVLKTSTIVLAILTVLFILLGV